VSQPAAAPAGRYVFQGREVTLPVIVRDAASGAATYLVSAAAARRLLPSPALEVVELLPGRALMSLACVDYRDNDLGDYNEVSIALFVRERGAAKGLPYVGAALDFLRNRLGTYIHHLPVNQSFTCEAGRGIWGFPKTVEEITFTDAGNRRDCRLVMDGRHVLTFGLARGGRVTLPDVPMTAYSAAGGVLYRTPFVSGARGVGFHLGGATLELGDHPVADELRSLGLPKRALMSVWMEHTHARFEGPQVMESK
jgi:Acetoacetate decarboxylase (ADC)